MQVSDSIVGSFKCEYKDIRSIAQLGMNTLSVLHINEAGEQEVSMKTGGIVKEEETSVLLTHQAFIRTIESSIQKYVTGTFQNQDASKNQVKLKVQNVRSRKRGLQTLKVRSEYGIEMRSVFLRRQLFNVSYPYVTYPHGYLGDIVKCPGSSESTKRGDSSDQCV